MAHQIKDSFKLALAQLNPVVGDLVGNVKKARQARAQRRSVGRRPDRLHRALSHRLPDRGSGAEAGVAEGGTRGLRGARARHGRRRARRSSSGFPGATDRSSITRSLCLIAAASRACATRTICPITACSTRSAYSRLVRCPEPIDFRGRQARRADLRGHLERGGVQGPGTSRRRPSDRAERLALLDGQAGGALRRCRDAGRRDAAAARLRQPGGRAGRTRVRRRVLRAQWRRRACGADARLGGRRSASPNGGARAEAGIVSRARSPRSRRGRPPTTSPASSACAITSTRTASPASCSGSRAASTRRCARRSPSMRSGASRVHGVMLPYVFTSNESLNDAAATRRGARCALRHHADRRRRRGADRRRSPRPSPAPSPTRPRRICSRARAARC